MQILVETRVTLTTADNATVDEFIVNREMGYDGDMQKCRELIQRSANSAKSQFDDEVGD